VRTNRRCRRSRSISPPARLPLRVDVGEHQLRAGRAKASAVPRPMPLAAPVTSATRPAKEGFVHAEGSSIRKQR
jgi:hypothetical protein